MKVEGLGWCRKFRNNKAEWAEVSQRKTSHATRAEWRRGRQIIASGEGLQQYLPSTFQRAGSIFISR